MAVLARVRGKAPASVVTLALAVALLYPVYHVIRSAFVPQSPTSGSNFQAFADAPQIGSTLLNTLLVAVFAGLLATIFGTILAVVTTLLPLSRGERRILRLSPMTPLTIPAMAGAVGWLFLLSPRVGWLNIWMRNLVGSSAQSGPLSAFSMPVVIWVMGLYAVPFVYTILASGMSRLNTELIEAYQISGSSMSVAILRAIGGPLRPAFFAGLSLAMVDCISQFSVPLILNVNTLPVFMYQEVTQQANYGIAAVAGLPLIAIAIALTVFQVRLASRGTRWATISGRGAGIRHLSFGKAIDRTLKAVAYLYLLVAGIAPLAAILVVSLMTYWHPDVHWHDLVLSNYSAVWNDSVARSGALTSAKLAVGCAIIATLIALTVVMLVSRTGGWLPRAAYFLANLPLGIPLVLLGIAFLVSFISGPLVLYGTIWLLVLAYSVAFLPIAVRNIGPLFQQVGRDLEEAAAVSGAGWLRSLRTITAPLITPGLMSSAVLLFMLIFREFPIAAFVSTPSTSVLSMSLVGYDLDGNWDYVAVIALFISVVSIVALLVSNAIASRFDLAGRTATRKARRRRGLARDRTSGPAGLAADGPVLTMTQSIN